MINIIAYGLDDEKMWRHLLESVLAESAVAEYKIFSSADAMLAAWTEDVHICIIDYYVAPFEGDRITHMILEKNPLCFVIMMSSTGNPDDIIKSFHNGLKRFIRKDNRDFTRQLKEYIEQGIEWVQRVAGWQSRMYALQTKMAKRNKKLNDLTNDNAD